MTDEAYNEYFMHCVANAFESEYDPDGSYTGTPEDGIDPTQDADDL